jgi:polyphosphate kinase
MEQDVGNAPVASGSVDAAGAKAESHTERFIAPARSWLLLNHRYLTEAQSPDRPLLERVKLISTLGSHLDEFLMEFVPQLRLRPATGVGGSSNGAPDLCDMVCDDRDAGALFWINDLKPALAKAGVEILQVVELPEEERQRLREYFHRDIFPLCTPLSIDQSHSFPFLADHTDNLLVVMGTGPNERHAFLNIPTPIARLVEIPLAAGASNKKGTGRFVWLDELVEQNVHSFFPGEEITAHYHFRLLRQTLITTEEGSDGDLLDAVRNDLQENRTAPVAALFIPSGMPDDLRRFLADNLQAEADVIFPWKQHASLRRLLELHHLDRPDLKYPDFSARQPNEVIGGKNYFKRVSKRDVLLVQPYDSFKTVVRFLEHAADDPQVIAIKEMLYHVGKKSPIAAALMRAAQNGKQVTVVMEIRAHFDEENNIEWALALKKAGVNVVYGAPDKKTHAKATIVVRRESDTTHTYAHISTVNYDAATAEHESDLGLLTSDPAITRDALELFNHLTGGSKQPHFRTLLVAPFNLRTEVQRRIEREAAHAASGEEARLIFQMDGLADEQLIDSLYGASSAGVEIDLLVRSICCLRPGLPDLSERIRASNFLGRFKEHSRIYYFRNRGSEEIFFGSADLMTAKVDDRVEILAPISDAGLRAYICDTLLAGYLRDNVSAAEIDENGNCRLPAQMPPTERFDLEALLIREAEANLNHRPPRKRDLTKRASTNSA